MTNVTTLWCEDEDLRPYRLHITCKPKSEPHVRALIVQNTGGGDVILRGMETTRAEEGDETRLSASLLLDGDAATRLENLVARLSIEPGIQAVHWHSANPEPLPATAAAGDDCLTRRPSNNNHSTTQRATKNTTEPPPKAARRHSANGGLPRAVCG